MLIALAAAVILAQAAATPAPAPATPAAEPTTPTVAAATVKPPKPKMICHDEVATGSIMSHRVCRTVEQVEADRQQSRRDTDALSDHLAACHGASC